MSEKCREPEPFDWLKAIGLGIAELVAEYCVRTEEQKPDGQRNDVALAFAELRKPIFSYLRHEVNKDLCTPLA